MVKRRDLVTLCSTGLALQALSAGGRAESAPTPAAPPTVKPAEAALQAAIHKRPIPGTGELIPVIGMGTSRTFDAPATAESVAQLTAVMDAFFAGGGTVIDSSPMYGQAEARVGDVLGRIDSAPTVFAASKVWTVGESEGIEQMQQSARRMGSDRLDLIAVHNLKDWKTHLDTLKRWKAEGRVRYIGITTSHGRDHDEFLQILRTEPLDFAQFSYNIEDRISEQRILPTAQDRGIATMINRPFQRGSLFEKVAGKPLPEFAAEFGCTSWAQFFLKFILSHPAVTCVIPASSKVKHMKDNMQANYGRAPTRVERIHMIRAVLRNF